jgi:hypothetical protein
LTGTGREKYPFRELVRMPEKNAMVKWEKV